MARPKKGQKSDAFHRYAAAYERLGSVQAVAKEFNVTRSCVQRSLASGGVATDISKMLGTLGGFEAVKMPLPAGDKVARYIITSAQNDTAVNRTFFDRLKMLAEFYDAKLMVTTWTYSPQRSSAEPDAPPQWAALLQDHIVTDRVELAPGLVLCGEITRVLPTAARPLSGFETYTGRASTIIPHAKIAMESVASMKSEPAKFLYTTGACTKHNYSRTKAGFKGEFHHAYGALVVEVTKSGWWVRQINADSQNRIYDLDICVDADGVTYGNEAEALVMGDVHIAEADREVMRATWGEDGLVDFMRPKQQILHDVFDMRSRPWQDELNFHRNYEKFIDGQESVEGEVLEARQVLVDTILRGWCDTVIVRSNHDLKLEKWLNTADYRKDLVNARFFLRAQLAKIDAIFNGQKKFKVLEWALNLQNVKFLDEDESYVICKNRGGGIECGQHGHLGPNGSRGTPLGLARLARKQIIGDKHVAGIYDGVYVVGTCTLNPAYVRGPSAWSATHCVVYENGKRALLTMWDGRFHAPRDKLRYV